MAHSPALLRGRVNVFSLHHYFCQSQVCCDFGSLAVDISLVQLPGGGIQLAVQ